MQNLFPSAPFNSGLAWLNWSVESGKTSLAVLPKPFARRQIFLHPSRRQ
jgi:hypothetical protein